LEYIKNIKKIKENAIILGCGPSINLLKEEHLSWINTLDIWTSNNFMIHSFIVPNFYLMETKTWATSFQKQNIKAKKEKYKNVTWLVENHHTYAGRQIVPNLINPKDFNNIYCFSPNFISGKVSNYIPIYGHVTALIGSSITFLIDITQTLNYKFVYLLGIDLYSSEYFWTDNPKYKSLDTPKRLKYNHPEIHKKTDKHSTSSRFLSYLQEFSASRNTNLINLSKNSLLSDFLLTQGLEEVVKT